MHTSHLANTCVTLKVILNFSKAWTLVEYLKSHSSLFYNWKCQVEESVTHTITSVVKLVKPFPFPGSCQKRINRIPISFLIYFWLFLDWTQIQWKCAYKSRCSRGEYKQLFNMMMMTTMTMVVIVMMMMMMMIRRYLTCLYPQSWLGSCQAVGTSPSRRWAAACGRPAPESSPPSGRQGPGRSRPHVQNAPRKSAMNINSLY